MSSLLSTTNSTNQSTTTDSSNRTTDSFEVEQQSLNLNPDELLEQVDGMRELTQQMLDNLFATINHQYDHNRQSNGETSADDDAQPLVPFNSPVLRKRRRSRSIGSFLRDEESVSALIGLNEEVPYFMLEADKKARVN